MNPPLEQLTAEAERAFAQGRLQEAERLCESGLRMARSLPLELMRGVIYVKTGRLEQALPLLERVAEEDDASPWAPLWRSRALRRLGRAEEALDSALQAAERDERDPSIRHHLGLCFLDVSQFADAVDCFQRAIGKGPNSAPAYQGLGLALRGLGRSAEAVTAFRRAAKIAPRSPSILASFWQTLMDCDDVPGAIECARTLLEIGGDSAESHLRLAQALLANGNPTEAETHVRLAMRFAPPSGPSAYLLGSVFQAQGRTEEAEEEFRRSLQIAPEQGAAYAAIVYGRKVREDDLPLVEKMEQIEEANALPLDQVSQLRYALGKASEDLGKYEAAMRYFDRANESAARGKLGGRGFDQKSYSERIDWMIEAFSGDIDTSGSSSDLPIFVVGMIRSGTTLVDGILSSHPDVGSAGEQKFWLENRNAVYRPGTQLLDMPKLRRLAAEYVALLTEIAPGKRQVVDKMPDNYLELPILHAAFPKAKIIHLRRNPVDTCISIYTTINRLGIEWTHRKEDIVFVYREYLRLMEHWRRVLPEGAMLEVRYEELVSKGEPVIRSIIDFCGLEWNDACLRPERNQRVVSTPSAWQVRQPLYTSSVDRWRRYDDHLGAFAELLD